ncbi:MAG TPA: hypothetical protein PK441_02085 [Burkholderiaceae bacterium]|nr:hypothetical protein [Burkholderiaceae bacterium]HOS85611.1 hypothetical protein [Burkholderiaceae bacterium]HPL79204.1 hypothetical protein [Burkholderiaceae bacterium]
MTGTLGLIGGGNRACVILGAGLKPGESPAGSGVSLMGFNRVL